MSNARNLARLIVDSGGDVDVSSLDNVPPSNDASALTTGTLGTARLPAGSVLQVVSTTKTDSFSSTSGTMVDITGLSLSITPSSATSKILILASLIVSSDSWNTGGMSVNLLRDSTDLSLGTGGSLINATSGYNAYSSSAGNTYGNYSPMVISFLDSPSSTSALTYKLQGRNNLNGYTWTVNRRMGDSVYVYSSTITVMEIAG